MAGPLASPGPRWSVDVSRAADVHDRAVQSALHGAPHAPAARRGPCPRCVAGMPSSRGSRGNRTGAARSRRATGRHSRQARRCQCRGARCLGSIGRATHDQTRRHRRRDAPGDARQRTGWIGGESVPVRAGCPDHPRASCTSAGALRERARRLPCERELAVERAQSCARSPMRIARLLHDQLAERWSQPRLDRQRPVVGPSCSCTSAAARGGPLRRRTSSSAWRGASHPPGGRADPCPARRARAPAALGQRGQRLDLQRALPELDAADRRLAEPASRASLVCVHPRRRAPRRCPRQSSAASVGLHTRRNRGGTASPAHASSRGGPGSTARTLPIGEPAVESARLRRRVRLRPRSAHDHRRRHQPAPDLPRRPLGRVARRPRRRQPGPPRRAGRRHLQRHRGAVRGGRRGRRRARSR